MRKKTLFKTTKITKYPIIPEFQFRVLFRYIYRLNYEEEGNVISILIRNPFLHLQVSPVFFCRLELFFNRSTLPVHNCFLCQRFPNTVNWSQCTFDQTWLFLFSFSICPRACSVNFASTPSSSDLITLPHIIWHFWINLGRSFLNPIQDGRRGGAKRPPTSFSSVTSTNVGFGPQNFVNFSFNPFPTLMQNFKFVPSASPKLLDLNQDHPSKNGFFGSNPYKIEVLITYFIEMLELPNFGHINTSTI